MASNSAVPPTFGLWLRKSDVDFLPTAPIRRRVLIRGSDCRILYCCSGKVVPIRRIAGGSGRKGGSNAEEWLIELKKKSHKVRIQAAPALPFASSQSRNPSRQEKFFPRCTTRNSGPQSRGTPPKRDTGIANDKDWGISLSEHVNESGINVDGTWYRESGEDFGENGFRCRWTKMGGKSDDCLKYNYEHFYQVGQGHGGRTLGTWEMARCTSMEKAQRVKVGISL